MKTSKRIITTIIFLVLISLVVPHGSCLDVSCRAIKARESNEYSPNTAWELGYTGKGINIAVIDTGVDDEHESLKNKFVAGVDVTNPLTPKDGSYNPDEGGRAHATFIAGCAMGTGGSTDNDGDGEPDYMGVAPDAKLIDVSTGFSYNGASTTESVIKCIEWCIKHKDTDWDGNGPSMYDGIDIITMSHWGYANGIEENGDGSGEAPTAVNKAVEVGIVVVCGAGNYGPDNDGFWDCWAADKAIMVGMIDDRSTVDRCDDEIANHSSRGPRKDDGDNDPYDELKPDVVAPGSNITSTWCYIDTDTENDYNTVGGTSFSTPHIAGVVALMLQANPNLKPTADSNPIQEILRKTAESKGTPDSDLGYEDSDSYYNKSYGWGSVDAYEAVKAALTWSLPPEPNTPPTVTLDNPGNNAKVSGIITISGTALDTGGNVSNVELNFDDNNWFNVSVISASSLEWNYTWNTKDVENGIHTIYARAYDGMNHSTIISVDVNVYNKVSAGVEENMKINPTYLISAAGIIGAVVIVVVCLLLSRRKRLAGLPASVPLQPATAVPSTVTIPPPPVTAVPSVSAQCQNCGNIIKITSAKRPLTVKCPKCGTKGMLR